MFAIDHIQITVKDMNLAEPFYDKLMPVTGHLYFALTVC